MNKAKSKLKKFNFNINLTKLVKKLLIRLIFIILPKIERGKLIKIGKKRNTTCIVEDEYEVVIREPVQSLAKERFKNSCGKKKLGVFLVLKLKMLDWLVLMVFHLQEKGKLY